MTTESSGDSRYWGPEGPNTAQVYKIALNDIKVPEPRVTSVYTPAQQEEFLASLKVEGQIQPVQLILVGEELWLADGLNRLVGMSQLGFATANATVRSGSVSDVQINNIATARHRGRENPAATATVIKDLCDSQNIDRAIVRQRLGISESWFNKLYKIATLPEEVLDHIKHGRLSVNKAYFLTAIENATDAIFYSNKWVTYGYTEEQCKLEIGSVLNPDISTETAGVIFQPDGPPQVLYPKCLGCTTELKSVANTAYFCEPCLGIAKDIFARYWEMQRPPPPGT